MIIETKEIDIMMIEKREESMKKMIIKKKDQINMKKKEMITDKRKADMIMVIGTIPMKGLRENIIRKKKKEKCKRNI